MLGCCYWHQMAPSKKHPYLELCQTPRGSSQTLLSSRLDLISRLDFSQRDAMQSTGYSSRGSGTTAFRFCIRERMSPKAWKVYLVPTNPASYSCPCSTLWVVWLLQWYGSDVSSPPYVTHLLNLYIWRLCLLVQNKGCTAPSKLENALCIHNEDFSTPGKHVAVRRYCCTCTGASAVNTNPVWHNLCTWPYMPSNTISTRCMYIHCFMWWSAEILKVSCIYYTMLLLRVSDVFAWGTCCMPICLNDNDAQHKSTWCVLCLQHGLHVWKRTWRQVSCAQTRFVWCHIAHDKHCNDMIQIMHLFDRACSLNQVRIMAIDIVV